MRGEAQLPALPVAHQQRAERRARALALRIAADDEVGAVGRLHLQPRAGALARFVEAVLALADHAFEAARHRRLVQGEAVLLGVHQLHQRRRQQALREVAPPVRVRRLAQVDAGEMQQVEAVEHRALGAAAPVLHGAEGRLAARVEGDDLAVEHHVAHRLLAELGDETRKVLAQLEPAPRAQLDALLVDESERAVAVELGLPHPVGAVERRVADLRVHRRELARQRADVAAGDELPGRNAPHRHGGDLLHGDAREHRAVLRGQIAALRHEAILVLDEQPGLAVLGAHQRERALELLAAQLQAELAGLEPLAHPLLGAARGRGTMSPGPRRANRRRNPRRSPRRRHIGRPG